MNMLYLIKYVTIMNAFEDNQVCPNPVGQRFNSDQIKKMKSHQLMDSEIRWFDFYGIVIFMSLKTLVLVLN